MPSHGRGIELKEKERTSNQLIWRASRPPPLFFSFPLDCRFFYVLSLTCHLSRPLNGDLPKTWFGTIIVLIVSAWGVCYIGYLIAKALDVKWSYRFVTRIENFCGAEEGGSLCKQIGAQALIVGIIIPTVLFIIVSLPAAGILAWAEDWSFISSFYYTITNVAHLPPPTPLTNVSPETVAGKIIDAAVALWVISLTLLTYTISAWPVFIDYLGSTLLYYAHSCRPVSKGIGLNGNPLGFFLAILIIIPFFMFILIGFCGPIIAGFEGWDIGDAYLYAASLISQQPLVDIKPKSFLGILFISLGRLCFDV